MYYLHFCILISLTTVESNDECGVNGYRKTFSLPSSYRECNSGIWTIENCPQDLIYNEVLSICVSKDFNESTDMSTTLDELNATEETTTTETAYFSTTKDDLDVTTTLFSNIEEESNTTKLDGGNNKSKFGGEDNATKWDGGNNDGGESTTHNLLPKAIPNGSKDQNLLYRPLIPMISNRKTVKTKANWTTSLLNGNPEYTDISFYQSNGRSYQFRIPGGLPAEQHNVIAWIRENSHNYPQVDIPYVNDDGSQGIADLPKALPSRCGTKFLEKLSGGHATPIEDNPWQVAVLRSAGEYYVCGGAVITRRHVLSAAHCFRRRSRTYAPEDILLRVGDYDKEVREESQVDYTVLYLLIHESYHELKHLNDIALLTTSEDIPFSSHTYPICLPTPRSEYTPGLACTVSGWGQVENDDVPTRYLRAGQVAIISDEDCSKKTIFAQAIIGLQELFCAEDPTKTGVDTCLGDSGGPFACNNNGIFYLFGITAFGSYPCGQDIPSFYTNVSFYRPWILNGIRSLANL